LTEEDDIQMNVETSVKNNTYGRSPLHEAIALRDLDSIRKYVSQNQFIDDVDNNGNTPYDMAYQEGYEEAVNILKKSAKVA
jgi:ankyrin repeat protein